ncbi:hypothetical protein Y887_17500 [Xanthomonas pisi DSM 18956]|uniref:DUF1040 domain-containing protein n=1 Tax=Xanthomonas pisi TaxID=56457 RepID=A0A2S7CQK0_9XANT|nr:hypothetical protein Y887_17500 [Xanthomonas pisi DSM 18956]PPU63868.1 hypothetical protein XpiCFBP4643_22895 [Xanthomonas pisi]
MRDPARIDQVLALLEEVWRRDPDLRLGQLIYNAARLREPQLFEVFSIEDSMLQEGLIRYLEKLQRTGSGLLK